MQKCRHIRRHHWSKNIINDDKELQIVVSEGFTAGDDASSLSRHNIKFHQLKWRDFFIRY